MNDRPPHTSESLEQIPDDSLRASVPPCETSPEPEPTTVPIRVAFFSGTGKWSRLIRWRTWGDGPAHVGLLTTDGANILHARPGRGVRVDRLEDSAKPGTVIDILEAQVPADAARILWAYAEAQLGKPYDWPGNLGFVIRKDVHDRDAWFCSELVAWLFYIANHPLLHRLPSWKYSPEDLWRSPLLTPVGGYTLRRNPRGQTLATHKTDKPHRIPENPFCAPYAPRQGRGRKNHFAGRCKGLLARVLPRILRRIIKKV